MNTVGIVWIRRVNSVLISSEIENAGFDDFWESREGEEESQMEDI